MEHVIKVLRYVAVRETCDGHQYVSCLLHSAREAADSEDVVDIFEIEIPIIVTVKEGV